VCFEKFLELFASEYPEDLHIIQLDNGGFHNSLWGYVKEQLKWLKFDQIEELRALLSKKS
jgi:hypothetical protein